MTSTSQGCSTIMTTNTQMARQIPLLEKTAMLGSKMSSVDMSFEKRVWMRPTGFESKNRMLVREMLTTICSCMFSDAESMMLKTTIARNSVDTT